MKFKYKFSTTMKVLFIVMYALAIGCFAWNLVRLFQSLSSQIEIETYTYIAIMLCLALPIVVSIFITCPNLDVGEWIRYFGLFFGICGLVFFIISIVTMKNNWRAGIS